MKAKRKRIPYGMMNFVDVREDDCYYVDKTRFIEKIENANRFFLHPPEKIRKESHNVNAQALL